MLKKGVDVTTNVEFPDGIRKSLRVYQESWLSEVRESLSEQQLPKAIAELCITYVFKEHICSPIILNRMLCGFEVYQRKSRSRYGKLGTVGREITFEDKEGEPTYFAVSGSPYYRVFQYQEYFYRRQGALQALNVL